jgi:hypothetical protein
MWVLAAIRKESRHSGSDLCSDTDRSRMRATLEVATPKIRPRLVLPLIVWEGREAMRGKACGCC